MKYLVITITALGLSGCNSLLSNINPAAKPSLSPATAIERGLPESASASAAPEVSVEYVKAVQAVLKASRTMQSAVTVGLTKSAYNEKVINLVVEIDSFTNDFNHKNPDVKKYAEEVKLHYMAANNVWNASKSSFIGVESSVWLKEISDFPEIKTELSDGLTFAVTDMVYINEVLSWHWKKAGAMVTLLGTMAPKQN